MSRGDTGLDCNKFVLCNQYVNFSVEQCLENKTCGYLLQSGLADLRLLHPYIYPLRTEI